MNAARHSRRWLSAFACLGAISGCQAVLGVDFNAAKRREVPPKDSAPSAAGAQTKPTGAESEPSSGGEDSQLSPTALAAGAGGAASADQDQEHGSGGAMLGGQHVCSDSLTWRDIAGARDDFGRAIAEELDDAVGVIFEDATPRCLGVLLSPALTLLADCDIGAHTKLSFGARADRTTAGGHPVRQEALGQVELDTERLKLLPTMTWVSWNYPPVAWSARKIVAGERATFISHASDGLGRVAFAPLNPEDFDRDEASSGIAAAVFGEDAKLLGFCSHDCAGLHACFTLASQARKSLRMEQLEAMSGVILGDIDGDGKVEPGVINSNGIGFRRDTLSPVDYALLGSPFTGPDHFALADVNGDGSADLISFAGGASVRSSHDGQFGNRLPWSEELSGAHAHALGDLNGDGLADVLELSHDSLYVSLTHADGFAAPQPWLSGIPAPYDVQLSDVTGDGLADAILIYDRTVEVAVSSGAAFFEPRGWLSLERLGTPGFSFADIDGDGRGDALYLDPWGPQLYRSTGVNFAFWNVSTAGLAIGQRGNYLADVTGDGYADALVHDQFRLLVFPGGPDGLLAPFVMVNDVFFGGL